MLYKKIIYVVIISATLYTVYTLHSFELAILIALSLIVTEISIREH